ncbi:MAG TPA: hypothetical protein VGJ54_13830 [Streptosporangiaceae bacterium]
MRAENASWPYNAPGRDDPDWSADNGSADDGRPDWTAGDDNWPPNGASPGWPYGEDHPSWPASGGSDWLRAGGGSSPRGREPAAAPRHDPRSPTTLPPAPGPRVRVPADGGPDGAAQWSGQYAAGAAPPSNYEVAFGNGPVQVLLPSAGQEWPAGADAGEMPHFAGERPAELHDPVQQDAGGFPNADSVRLAERILSDADTQAAGIRQEALGQANAIREAAEREADEVRRQAAYQVDAAREAEREAEEIKRQAEYQANAIREAAAQEADELRAGAIRLSAELGQVAAYVTRTLTIPAITAGEPEALPGPELIDDGGPGAQAAQPRDWQPGASPRPQGRPRPQARSRQRLTDTSPPMPAVEPQDWHQDGPPAGPGPQGRSRPHDMEGFAGPAMPAAEPQAWPQAAASPPWQETADPQAWQQLEEAWGEEEGWEQDGWEPESPPAARPRPEGRTTTRPQGRPAARPRSEGRTTTARPRPEGRTATARPQGGTAAKTRPGSRAAAGSRPGGRAANESRPGGKKTLTAKGRQLRFKNRMVFAYAALLVIPLFVGVTELAMHGWPFFVFRNAGAAAGNPQHLEENQGPGQPDAPGAHHSVKPSPPSSAKPTPSKAN